MYSYMTVDNERRYVSQIMGKVHMYVVLYLFINIALIDFVVTGQ